MANFATHLKFGIVSSAIFSSTVLAAGIINPVKAIFVFLIGSIAGLLPDLDADKSTSIHWIFSIFALVTVVLSILSLPYESLFSVWAIVLLGYTLVMYIAKPLFESLTVHRGSMHSLLAVIMYAVIATCLIYSAQQDLNLAMVTGISVLIGALTHLILDECYSVDLENREIKNSFGSAIKLFDHRYPVATIIQLIVIAGSVYLLADHSQAINKIWNSWLHKLQSFTILPSSGFW